MADVPERLFRDDAGAALERVARLEEENQQLRAENARLRDGAHPRRARDATTVRTARPAAARAVLAITMGLMLTGTVMAARVSHRDACHARPHFPRVAVTTPRITPAPTLAVAPAPTLQQEESCATPYFYDVQGVKHYKMHCIHPERTR